MTQYEYHGISNYWLSTCLFNSLFSLTEKKNHQSFLQMIEPDSVDKNHNSSALVTTLVIWVGIGSANGLTLNKYQS